MKKKNSKKQFCCFLCKWFPKFCVCKFFKNKTLTKKFYLIFTLVLIIFTLYLFKDQFIVALVNKKPIFRFQYLKSLEKQAGQKILDNLIIESLITQEGVKKGITITQEDINNQIAEIKKNFNLKDEEFNDLLQKQNTTLKELENELKLQKTLEKLADTEISVSAEEVNAYLTENKDLLPQGQPLEQQKESALQNLKQQKLSQIINDLLIKLKQEAKIIYFSKINNAASN